MPSDENRVILAALAATTVAFAVLLVVDRFVGQPGALWSLVGFLVFGVLAVAAPQLYLARTDSSVPASGRIWATVAILFLLAISFSANADSWGAIAIWAVTCGAFLLAAAHEVRSGYRSTVE